MEMGIKNFRCLNKAFLSKWSWIFPVIKKAFWSDVIRGKYGEFPARGWGGRVCCGFWKAIQTWWPLVSSKISFVVVGERGVKFWRDAWLFEVPLSVYISSLFAIADSMLGQEIVGAGDRMVWVGNHSLLEP